MNTLAPAPLPPKTTRSLPGEIVCFCLQITETDIHECVEILPSPTVEDISTMTGAGTGCTGCRVRIQRVLDGKPACGNFGFCSACGTCRAVCPCRGDAGSPCRATATEVCGS